MPTRPATRQDAAQTDPIQPSAASPPSPWAQPPSPGVAPPGVASPGPAAPAPAAPATGSAAASSAVAGSVPASRAVAGSDQVGAGPAGPATAGPGRSAEPSPAAMPDIAGPSSTAGPATGTRPAETPRHSARQPTPPSWEPAWELPPPTTVRPPLPAEPATPSRPPRYDDPLVTAAAERALRAPAWQPPAELPATDTSAAGRTPARPTAPVEDTPAPRHGREGERPGTPRPGVTAAPPARPPRGYAPQPGSPPHREPAHAADPFVPTAEEFARRRAARPPDPVAVMGLRGAVRRSTLGLVRLGPGRREQEYRHDVEMVRRNFGGLRQVTVVNPKGGAGKTVAVLLTAMTFGQKRGGYVLAWDNNETQGTLGMRAQQDFHVRTVRDLLRDLKLFAGSHGRVGDLSQYVRAQGEGMFDVLASDESATAGEMLTSSAFAEIRDVVSRFYKLIFVDTGNNVRAANWQAAIDATDQLVVTMSARNDSAETAARMLDHLEQTGRHRLVRQAVTVVSMPPIRKDIDLPPIQRHFAARTRMVLLAPYERLLDSGEPIRYSQLSTATREAWLKIAAAVAEGL
ncbi:MAG TPA: chromosome partitioning protein [Micromonosporaceae bacterium]|nr:chromosome partitioning protein [Micromonosporaceae bacterium]